ncbi:MAG: UDP-glucose--hexose-1-phosphate uridylyltransferase [Coriobacteriales bacterium]|nr:UDP-glucose--hexose-1-phosphate uridylyltransferase [Coriobacteriales bacterium]
MAVKKNTQVAGPTVESPATSGANAASSESAEARDAIQSLVDYAARHGLVDWDDRTWAYNSVLEAIGAVEPGPTEGWVLAEAPAPRPAAGQPVDDPSFDLEGTLTTLAQASVDNGRDDDTQSGRDRASMRVMGLLMPRPSFMAARFRELHGALGPRAATNWFYGMCCDAGYVRRAAIARNVQWTTATPWGDLEITINLSKPEKDPREIAAAGRAPKGQKYPACQLCIENEGYPGRAASHPLGAHPARQNLRIIPIQLGGERWGLQYSPYAYFNEHCIAMSSIHRPMHVDRTSLGCLFDFVDLLPHYFIGSNADLPVVGGSILSHDHFQGGAHELPMMRAAADRTFRLPSYPDVTAEVLRWPLSVLRLSSASRGQLLDACEHVVSSWRAWSDPSVGVIAQTPDGTPHNTVTPIVRRVDACGKPLTGTDADAGGRYEAYLALRCNVTSPEHPLGVFHPHEQWHHIKRENIGLIEVMGLAILPPRLVGELGRVEQLLLAGADLGALKADPLAASHADWAAQLAQSHPELNQDNVHQIVRDGVGEVFSHVLEDAGVFKWDQKGRAAQDRFIQSL